MSKVLNEITPLSDKDCFYVAERHKSEFLFPLHQHREYELNFIENGRGVRRIVGDSVEEIGDWELTLIAEENLEHAWEQGSCKSKDVREITIQFDPELFGEKMQTKSQFASILKMLVKAEHGLTFSMRAIMKSYPLLDRLASEQNSFDQYLDFLKILYELSLDEEARVLSSSSFANTERTGESRRVLKVKQYINDNYKEDLRLPELAAMAGMTPSAFSRFFKLRTGRTLTDYVLDIKLGHAARMLVDTAMNISEICYACGFNNLSNFNRLFKANRGATPREFRALYKKNQVIV